MLRRSPIAWAAALVWCAVLGWFAFVRGRRVPLLSLVDFGFHELGHLICYILPVGELITAMAGSGMQVLVPLGLAVSFAVFRRDAIGAVCCAAWATTSMQDASVYIADAPYQNLQLVGGEHDWAFALGEEGLDRMQDAARIASTVRVAGLLLLGAAIVVTLVGLIMSWGPDTDDALALPTEPYDSSVPRV